MAEDSPVVIVIAGPNGAGKSTAAPALLQGPFKVTEFVNADVIARGLSAFDPDGAALDAGRIMLERIDKLTEARTSFAFETTLASRSFAPRIKAMNAIGYRCRLFYFWLPDAETSVQRVHSRVATGGHSIPDETIRRRYGRSLSNLIKLYLPIIDVWRVYNSSPDAGATSVIAAGEALNRSTVYDAPRWAQITGVARGHGCERN